MPNPTSIAPKACMPTIAKNKMVEAKGFEKKVCVSSCCKKSYSRLSLKLPNMATKKLASIKNTTLSQNKPILQENSLSDSTSLFRLPNFASISVLVASRQPKIDKYSRRVKIIFMSKEPKYEVLESYEKIELRLYEPFLVAEVECLGVRKEAIRSGFRILANYIFGNNRPSLKLPMSIPVTQQKIGNAWKIRFMLTQTSDLDDLPRPNNQLVKLHSISEKKFATIRFSGIANDEKIERYTIELREFAASRKWPLNERAILAFYNPPWTLPFLRRNEILFEVLK